MMNLWKALVPGVKWCPECDVVNPQGQTYCFACGARIRNRNPLVRLLVTILAILIVVSVLWWRWRS